MAAYEVVKGVFDYDPRGILAGFGVHEEVLAVLPTYEDALLHVAAHAKNADGFLEPALPWPNEWRQISPGPDPRTVFTLTIRPVEQAES